MATQITASYRAIADRLAAGGMVLLDGATGTELERRGAPMSSGAWCALATEAAPDLLREVHADYLAAGADVIIVNSFANARWMLRAAGAEARWEAINRQAVAIAREARDTAGFGCVAGAISCMRPIPEGTDNPDDGLLALGEAEARAGYRELAQLFAAEGCDLIVMEMMMERDHSRWAVEAALETGLPVWVGYSVKRDAAGALVPFSRPPAPMAEVFAEIAALGGDAAGVMHSSANDTGPGLDLLKQYWGGPLLAYPESGHFAMPHWQFEDVMSPAELVRYAEGWTGQGVQILGGCCGLGVEHIAALKERFG